MTALQERVAALLGQEAALFLPTATMANQIALKLHSRPGDVLLAEETSHVVIYEYGGAAAHAGLDDARAARACRPRHARAGTRSRRAEHEGGRPAGRRALARGHAQQLGRARLAARRAGRGRRDGPRARSRRAPRRRAAPQRRGRPASRACRDRVAVRHGDALPLEGARLPARRAARRSCGIDRASLAREAPLRRRDAPGGHRRRGRCLRARPPRRPARRRPRPRAPARRGVATAAGCRSISSRWRRTSSSSTSARLGLARDEALARLREAGVGLSSTIHPTRAPRRHAPRPDRRGHRSRLRARAAGAGSARVRA